VYLVLRGRAGRAGHLDGHGSGLQGVSNGSLRTAPVPGRAVGQVDLTVRDRMVSAITWRLVS
jgi:hypothetical protein